MFYLQTKPLSEDKISHQVISALSLKDGTPTIIELGHPNHSSRTHLLILNPDIITTDGSFYRERFTPLEP